MKLLKFFLSILILSAAPAQADPLRIAAAADMKFAMVDLVAQYEKLNPTEKVEIILGSSGTFYHQILNGAPFDIFFSADIGYPRKLKELKLTASEIRPYAIGRIVLWSTAKNAAKFSLDTLATPEIKKISIANPKHAPYGMRAQETLEKTGIWEKVQDKLIFGENISHAAQFAASGAADVGIIALSLAMSPTFKTKGTYTIIPENLHAPLEQGYVVLKRAEQNSTAKSFADFIAGKEARSILRNYGFSLPNE